MRPGAGVHLSSPSVRPSQMHLAPALTRKTCRCHPVVQLNGNRTDKRKSFHRLKTNNKNKTTVSFPQMKSTRKVLCDSKVSRVEMERSEMSKTPLFCKESTPRNILIPHVNNKILSHLPVPAPRALGGWRAGSSAAEGQAELGLGRHRRNQVLLHVVCSGVTSVFQEF